MDPFLLGSNAILTMPKHALDVGPVCIFLSTILTFCVSRLCSLSVSCQPHLQLSDIPIDSAQYKLPRFLHPAVVLKNNGNAGRITDANVPHQSHRQIRVPGAQFVSTRANHASDFCQ